jgi:hypothetical protein
MTYMAVVLAADGVGRARGTTHTNHGDGRASESDEGGHILHDDAEQSEERSCRGVAGLQLKRVSH